MRRDHSTPSLFGEGPEPEEGRAPKHRRVTARDRMLIDWIRVNGPASSECPPLGFAARDLRRLELEGLLVGEGAQVRTYRVATGGAR